jgi:hypothetical protein
MYMGIPDHKVHPNHSDTPLRHPAHWPSSKIAITALKLYTSLSD